MEKLRIAIPTRGRDGLEDTVSEVFGRASTFTIIDVEGNKIKHVEVAQNPAASYKHGAGPIVVKMLADMGVNKIVAGELGPGVSTLLEQFKIDRTQAKSGSPVEEIIESL